jgi:hypothetical protein
LASDSSFSGQNHNAMILDQFDSRQQFRILNGAVGTQPEFALNRRQFGKYQG